MEKLAVKTSVELMRFSVIANSNLDRHAELVFPQREAPSRLGTMEVDTTVIATASSTWVSFNAYQFPNASEAIQHVDASGRGVSMRIRGRRWSSNKRTPTASTPRASNSPTSATTRCPTSRGTS